MTNDRVRVIADVLRADPSVAAAMVYGSAARGQLRADSDLDIAILRTRGARVAERSVLAELGGLGVAAGRDVHLTDLAAADSALRRAVFTTGTLLFDRSDGGLRQLEHATAIEYVDWEYARRIIDAGLARQLEHLRG